MEIKEKRNIREKRIGKGSIYIHIHNYTYTYIHTYINAYICQRITEL